MEEILNERGEIKTLNSTYIIWRIGNSKYRLVRTKDGKVIEGNEIRIDPVEESLKVYYRGELVWKTSPVVSIEFSAPSISGD